METLLNGKCMKSAKYMLIQRKNLVQNYSNI